MIRHAKPEDIRSITHIYNEAIIEGGFTGDLDPVTVENRTTWLTAHKNNYAVFVKEIDGLVVGYIALSPYRNGRPAFSETCEISYFISSQYRGQGLGKQLLKHALSHTNRAGFNVVVAFLLGCNIRSIKILERFGFSECGRVVNAAMIQGVHMDHVFMSKTS